MYCYIYIYIYLCASIYVSLLVLPGKPLKSFILVSVSWFSLERIRS